MSRSKCTNCGLVNFSTDEACRRCGAILGETSEEFIDAGEEKKAKRSLGQRIAWITGTTFVILFIWYTSLLMSSDALSSDQKRELYVAINVLDERGFGTEATMLRHVVNFRSTDNWWNRYVGHRDAYASTNFPFEVVTLYPEFFTDSADDEERAAILLHESYHLFGHGEAVALEGVWRNKQKLGWTAEKYEGTKVWNSTRSLTRAEVPKLFQCGDDGQSDCMQ